jgi:hypothetical protein
LCPFPTLFAGVLPRPSPKTLSDAGAPLCPNSHIGDVARGRWVNGWRLSAWTDQAAGQRWNARPQSGRGRDQFHARRRQGIEPKDQVEAMLGVQMAAVHNATMTFARHLAHAEIIMQQDSAENAFNKLARTFAAQVEALPQRRRAKDDGSACPRRRGWAGGRRQRQRSGRGGRAAEKIGDSTPCSCICTWRRDATPNRSGAGYSAGRRRFGDARGRWRRSKGNRNAKHGDFTAEGLALKREIQALARMTRASAPRRESTRRKRPWRPIPPFCSIG